MTKEEECKSTPEELGSKVNEAGEEPSSPQRKGEHDGLNYL